MCRSSAQGGRRCPGGGRDTSESVDAQVGQTNIATGGYVGVQAGQVIVSDQVERPTRIETVTGPVTNVRSDTASVGFQTDGTVYLTDVRVSPRTWEYTRYEKLCIDCDRRPCACDD